MSAAEDQVAVDKVLLGDTEAFEGIVRRWQRPLVNLAYRFCRDAGRAEEMAQEAFLRAYRSLEGWRREAAFSTWLFALATNLYCSELRRVPIGTVPLDAIAEPRDPRAVDGGLGEADRDRTLRSAVFALPPKYRETFILFFISTAWTSPPQRGAWGCRKGPSRQDYPVVGKYCGANSLCS